VTHIKQQLGEKKAAAPAFFFFRSLTWEENLKKDNHLIVSSRKGAKNVCRFHEYSP